MLEGIVQCHAEQLGLHYYRKCTILRAKNDERNLSYEKKVLFYKTSDTAIAHTYLYDTSFFTNI